MKSHPGLFARAARTLLCLALLLGPHAPLAAAGAPPAPQAPAPRALVKSIVVGGAETDEAGPAQVQLTRADGTAAPAVTAGLALYTGDTLQTFADTRVTLLFLDPPVPERGNEVIVEADSRVSVSSTYSWWGTIWVKVKGAFNSRTKYVRLAAQGTEYEFRVERGEERSSVVVLEGGVEVSKGAFNERAGAGRPAPPAQRYGPSPALLTRASYAAPGQEQFGRAIDVPAGQVTNIEYTFHLTNQCRQPHSFTFHTSAGAEWLRVTVASGVAVRPGRKEPVRGTVTIDATRLQPGVYRGRIYSECAECDREPQCDQTQLEWPINLTVRGATGPTPTPTATPVPTPAPTPTPTSAQPRTFLVRELEEATLTPGPDRPERASRERVLAALEWTNDVLLSSQPTYPERNVLPHFADPAQRGRSLRAARRSAVLEGDRPGGNRALGDVFTDWGQGAWALKAYERELAVDQTRRAAPDFMADLGEAHRLAGQFAQAQASLGQAAAADPRAARVQNARGNLALDRARVALDTTGAAQAAAQLEQAREAYQAAAQQGTRDPRGAAVVRTNLGEAHLLAGELALRRRNAAEARTQLEASEQQLNSARQADPDYPFAATDLGRTSQRLGNAAVLAGDTAEARAQYAKAEGLHRQALARHRDMAEAYFHLGDLYEDWGEPEAAEESYRRAVRARPEQPDAYFPLALLVQDKNPRLAAELAAVFLQLLREEFKQGERARAAERIRRGERVTPPPRLVPPLAGGREGRGEDGEGVVVPEVLRKSRADAVKAVEQAGLTARVEQRAGARSSDPVSEQRPAAGERVARGSAVELVLTPRAEAVKVPEVKDDKLETARRKVTERGLTVGHVSYRETCDSVGEVLEQNPRDGTRVERGSAVDLVVGSVGENPLTLPNWVGQSRASAEAEIASAGLRLGGVSRVEVEGGVEGQVVRHRPAAGTQLPRGCEVKLEVAVPVQYVLVGDYVGMAAGDALNLLSREGLRGLTRERVSEGPAGRVLGQSEPPGSRVRKGSFVTLLVSARQQFVQVPQLVGMDIQQARVVLRNLRLRWAEARQHHSDYRLNEVFAQDPQPGQQVPEGTVVRLMVSAGWPPPGGRRGTTPGR